MSLTLRTVAIKRVNRGGHHGRQNPKTGEAADNGTDYVVFNCPLPKCGKRNKQSLYDSLYSGGGATAFKCNGGCGTTTEVVLPVSDRRSPLIVSPEQFKQTRKDLRKDLAAIHEQSRILGGR